MASPLEDAFRRTVDTGFHQSVAFGTLSILGALVSLPVVTVGPAVFGVAHAIVTLSRRGSQHGVGETAELFVQGLRRYLVEGIAISAFVLFFALGIVANGFVLATGAPVWLAGLVALSTLFLLGCFLVALHAVALVACGLPPRAAIRDGTVLLFGHSGTTVGQGLVVASIFVLGHLTIIGWALIGFAVAVSFTVRTTDRLYQESDGNSPIYQ